MAIAIGQLQLLDDVRAGDWVLASLHPFARDVGSFVPPVFEAYARALHPARRGDVLVRWAEIAAANDRTMHSKVQFTKIALIAGGYAYGRSQPGLWDQPPRVGSLDEGAALAIADTLKPMTTTPSECYFAYWEGRGGLVLREYAVRKLQVPQRVMFLARGELAAVMEPLVGPGHLLTRPLEAGEPVPAAPPLPPPFLYQSPSLWWPADHAWCVATDVDLDSTYVSGSAACVQALLDNPDLEVLRTGADAVTSYVSDDLNPEPPSHA
jgi:hypothetical protein